MSPDQMPHAFGLLNGVLPVAGLMALAVVLPMLFSRWIGESQIRLALAMFATAAGIFVAGAALLAWLTITQNTTATEDPLTYLARAVKLALGWGPVWALVWLMRAQGAETRKGLKMLHDAEAGKPGPIRHGDQARGGR